MNNEAVIFGYSGHAYVVIEIINACGYTVTGYNDIERKLKNPFNLTYLGEEPDDNELKNSSICNAFVCIGNNNIRAGVFKKLERNNIACPSAVHPKASVSPTAVIGAGTIVMAGAVINAMAKIGKAVICNSASVIEHECTIGDFVHVAPGAVLTGNVTVGNNTVIGANAIVKPGITIGINVTVGAGAVVLNDVPDGVTIFGNPARIKQHE